MSNPSQSVAELWSEEQLLADVEAGPEGPRVGAFVDFDGTGLEFERRQRFGRKHVSNAGEHSEVPGKGEAVGGKHPEIHGAGSELQRRIFFRSDDIANIRGKPAPERRIKTGR